MLTPQTETELVDVIRDAASGKRSLEIIGGGSKRSAGGLVRAEEVVSIGSMAGILAYNPAEMVMTARAGTPLGQVIAAAAENRQHLAFEPSDYRALLGSESEPTIGGLFATNLAGPRRFQAGSARDHLLGTRFVNGFGDIVNAGGRVMKNVTGLDLVKLMAGSWGTLGIMTELTFKLQPMPQTSATLVYSGLDDTDAIALLARALATPAEVSGAAFLPESCRSGFLDNDLPDGSATVLRLEGLDFSVAERLDKLEAILGHAAPCLRLDHDRTSRLWRDIAEVRPFAADGRERAIWKISMAPSAGHQLLSALRMQTGLNGYYDWQGGLLWLRMEADAEAELIRAGIRHFGGGHATLFRATEAERTATSAFEPEAPAVAALNRRIREKFDPDGIFNPGRMGL